MSESSKSPSGANSKAFLAAAGSVALAHQGGDDEVPENTLRAFRHAVDLGYTHIETDVHATSDGVVICFHDPTLDRVTDLAGLIRDHTWDQIKDAVVLGSESLLRLDEALTTFGDTFFNIDSKHTSVMEPLMATLRRHDALDRVCLSSFSDRRLRRLRRLAGAATCTAAGPFTILRMRLASYGLPMGSIPSDVLQVPVKVGPIPVTDARMIAECHRRGKHLHVWTIGEEAEMRRLLDLGVDGIITQAPTTMKRVLIDRGEWFGADGA